MLSQRLALLVIVLSGLMLPCWSVPLKGETFPPPPPPSIPAVANGNETAVKYPTITINFAREKDPKDRYNDCSDFGELDIKLEFSQPGITSFDRCEANGHPADPPSTDWRVCKTIGINHDNLQSVHKVTCVKQGWALFRIRYKYLLSWNIRDFYPNYIINQKGGVGGAPFIAQHTASSSTGVDDIWVNCYGYKDYSMNVGYCSKVSEFDPDFKGFAQVFAYYP
eukprot:Nk52_evm3s225 gene=Nk52_evmTU3s225